MDALRQYVISVTAASIICGVVMCLSPSGSAQGVLKLLCGLFLAFTVIRPIVKIDIDQIISDFALSYSVDGTAAAAFGENLSREAAADIIKAETKAYILDKAAAMNVFLEAEVTLSGDEIPVPVAVELHGDISPYARQQLEQVIENDLGISKENQLWTG